jgi:hypothetical protein
MSLILYGHLCKHASYINNEYMRTWSPNRHKTAHMPPSLPYTRKLTELLSYTHDDCITHTHTHVYIYTHTNTYICTHTHKHVYIFTQTRIYIHTNTYIHTHTHTHTNTYTHTCLQNRHKNRTRTHTSSVCKNCKRTLSKAAHSVGFTLPPC